MFHQCIKVSDRKVLYPVSVRGEEFFIPERGRERKIEVADISDVLTHNFRILDDEFLSPLSVVEIAVGHLYRRAKPSAWHRGCRISRPDGYSAETQAYLVKRGLLPNCDWVEEGIVYRTGVQFFKFL